VPETEEEKRRGEMTATNNDLLTLLGNLQNVDAGGCPAPFISESLYPFKSGCKSNYPSSKRRNPPRGEGTVV
jgi:hypothetical protein